MDLDEHSMSVCDAYKIMFSVTSVRMADVNKFCDAHNEAHTGVTNATLVER
jgi:hypothetical protein